MELLTEQNLEKSLKNLPKFSMSDDAYASIQREIFKTRPQKRYPKTTQTLAGLAGLAVVSVVGVTILHTQHTVTPKYRTGSHQTQTISVNDSNFPYSNYLGFEPQSPTDTLGLKLSSSSINIDGQEGSSISAPSFFEVFGDSHTQLVDNKLQEASTGWFELTEQSGQGAAPSLMGLRLDKTVSINDVNVFIANDSSGDTHLGYIKDRIDFEFLFPKGYNLQTIENVVTSLKSITNSPSTMAVSDNITKLTSMLDFSPLVPGHVSAPFHQNGPYSVQAGGSFKMLTIPYVSADANFLVIETSSNDLSIENAMTTGRVETINGHTVYITTPSTNPSVYVTWIDPKGAIGIQVMTSKQNLTEAEQLAKLFINGHSE